MGRASQWWTCADGTALIGSWPGATHAQRQVVCLIGALRRAGRHLSTLLAQELGLPDSACLIGTIHADNTSAYRAAIALAGSMLVVSSS